MSFPCLKCNLLYVDIDKGSNHIPGLHSSLSLRSVCWQLFKDVSGETSLSNYQHTLRNNTEEQRLIYTAAEARNLMNMSRSSNRYFCVILTSWY
jgi:hypothetical protein